jgi:hypothetical protein
MDEVSGGGFRTMQGNSTPPAALKAGPGRLVGVAKGTSQVHGALVVGHDALQSIIVDSASSCMARRRCRAGMGLICAIGQCWRAMGGGIVVIAGVAYRHGWRVVVVGQDAAWEARSSSLWVSRLVHGIRILGERGALGRDGRRRGLEDANAVGIVGRCETGQAGWHSAGH